MIRIFRALWHLIRLVSVLAILTASACPTFDPTPPPRISAPVITLHSVTGCRLQNSWREVIQIQWNAPTNDSLGIAQYQLFRRIAPDTAYTIAVLSIPDTARQFFDRIEVFGFPTPPATSYRTVVYKLVAIDTLGRESDPCFDSLVLLWQPSLNAPATDTLKTNTFAWHFISKNGDQISSKMYLWDSTGLRWESGPTDTAFAGEYEIVADTMQLPDSLFPLRAGSYAWGVKVSVFGGRNPESIAIRKMNVIP